MSPATVFTASDSAVIQITLFCEGKSGWTTGGAAGRKAGQLPEASGRISAQDIFVYNRMDLPEM
jgi:hypothetical protein